VSWVVLHIKHVFALLLLLAWSQTLAKQQRDRT
jgi:hypothetical protein